MPEEKIEYEIAPGREDSFAPVAWWIVYPPREDGTHDPGTTNPIAKFKSDEHAERFVKEVLNGEPWFNE